MIFVCVDAPLTTIINYIYFQDYWLNLKTQKLTMSISLTPHRLINLLKMLGVTALYTLLAELVISYSATGFINIVYPSSGLGLAAVLIGGKRYALCVYFGALLINIIAKNSFWLTVTLPIGSTLEALFGAWLLTRNNRQIVNLYSLGDYLRLIVFGGAFGSCIAAIPGATILLVSGTITAATYFLNMVHWWMGDALGIIMITPLVLVWRRVPTELLAPKKLLELALVFGLTFLVGQIIFLGWFHEAVGLFAKETLMFLFITLAAVRLETHGTMLVLTLIATQGLIGAINGAGYFATDLAKTQMTNYWLYMVTLSLVGMAMAIYINERKRAEVALQEREQRLQTIIETEPECIKVISSKGKLLEMNAAGLTMLEANSLAEVQQHRLVNFILPEYRTSFSALHQRVMNGESGKLEFEITGLKNTRRWLEIHAAPLPDANGKITMLLGITRDITDRKCAEDEIKQLAFYDPLTSLPNRRLLLNRLTHGIQMGLRDGKQMALMMLDLDRFKAVNDSFGHGAGDELLQQVAERLTARLRDVDMVARLGGDEFIVLLDDITHQEDPARVAEVIIADLSKSFQLSQCSDLRIGVSIGISLFPQHGDSPEILLNHADTALYKAKDNGRGSFAYFSEDMTLAVRKRIELEARLRKAISQQDLRVFYQPQVDIASGLIIGAEALVRWQDQTEGLITPDRFIPIAEETGLIMAIGEWVLRETCRQGRKWLDEGLPSLTLAVNVSPMQFRHSDINALVIKILIETGFPGQQLELELTESGLMESQDKAVAILNNLRAQGIRLVVDDFGTGYSSLSYLKRFPLDVLKIDKSFIDDIPLLKDDMVITATIIAMGHTLGFKVLAEGVETTEQLAFLREKGCDTYQGYIKSPPISAEEFAKLFRGQKQDE
jgi:diguanylate cyclase (GGDEF)-like protein/PAS domain S-box-containing protein